MSKLFWASGITLGILLVFVTGGIMVILLFADAVNLYFAISLTVVVGTFSWLVGPFFTDYLNKWFYKVKFHTEAEVKELHPAVWEIVSEVSSEKKFKFPKIGIIPDDNPTAYTYGSGRYNARVILTRGLFTYLDESEVKAVVAHELGHVVNRDFIVMMVASILLQILYEIYATLIRARGRKSGGAKLIAIGFYVLYIIGIFLVYYLSRTREYLADAYSATKVPPRHLAKALVKIGYGILSTHDEEGKSDRLLRSTRHLGIVDVKNAKHVGATAALAHEDVRAISEVMAFDVLSPWAKLIEINSTHPLTGKRLMRLEVISQEQGDTFPYDIDTAIAGTSVNRKKLYKLFFRDLGVLALPLILPAVGIVVAPSGFLPGLAGLGLLILAFYKYPNRKFPLESTILEQMRNPYASPVRGVPVALTGKVIGRGMPGYVFSEDLMLQDSTGITFLNYTSLFSWIGNLFFALTKVKKLIGQSVRASGWFFRAMSSSVSLRRLATETGVVGSYPFAWALVLPVILIVWSGYLYAWAGGEYRQPVTSSEFTEAFTPSSYTSDWQEHVDEELGISILYPPSYTIEWAPPKNQHGSKTIRIRSGENDLVYIEEKMYGGETAQDILRIWLQEYDKRYAGTGISWAIDEEDKDLGIYYLYPIVETGTSQELFPAFLMVGDFGSNRMLTLTLTETALMPEYQEDVFAILDSIATERPLHPGI